MSKAKADEKIFSLNDLIDMGLVTHKDIEHFLRYMEAKRLVKELFPGLN